MCTYKTNTYNAFKITGAMDINTLIKYHIAISMYKITKGLSPDSVSEILRENQLHNNNYNTRFKAHIRKPQITLNISTNSIAWKGADIWNALPESLKAEHSLLSTALPLWNVTSHIYDKAYRLARCRSKEP